jgi:regulation of enolase protein 1 (concanavalin A-like superfamily)
VHVVSGDSENFDSVFQHNIEGVITPTTFPDTSTRFFEYTNTVIVDDGRLTIGNGPLAQNNKVDFVDVYPATATLPVIGTHPQSLTVEDHHAATFSVTLSSGSVPFRYQWLHDEMPIPGATGPTLTLSEVVMADAGFYKVAVSNYAGAVTSDAAMLTVIPDTNPPVVVKAVSLDGLTITLCFNEVMDKSSAEDTFNYITANGVQSAVLLDDGRTVIITLVNPVSDTFSIQVNNVVDRAGVGSGQVPTSGRVLGFVGEDIGAPTLPGNHSTCDGSTFVITSGGTNIAGIADQFHFVSCTVQGNFEVRVRVTDLAISNVFARALLMVRESNTAGSRHATLSVMAPQPGRDLGEPLARGTAGGATAGWGANFSPAGIPVWLRITRAGNTITGYRSADGMNWTQVAQTTITLPAGLLVGMGVTSQDAATLATATFRDFRIDWLTPAPAIMNPVYNGGTFSGSFSSVAGLSYNIQYKDDLAGPSWTLLTTLGGTGSPVPFSDPGPPSSTGLRVYRVRLR